MMNNFKRRVFEYAKRYAEKGWAVLPVHTIIDGRCTCGNRSAGAVRHGGNENPSVRSKRSEKKIV